LQKSLQNDQRILSLIAQTEYVIIEQILTTDAMIPKIIELISDQTIIYTEYVTEIMQTLSEAISMVKLSVALYTRETKELEIHR